MYQYKQQYGFTLIELMIVVAIIGILASIAVPQFITFRIKAFNATATSDLKNLATTISTYSNEPYPNTIVGTGAGILTLTNGTTQKNVALSKGVSISINVATNSASKRCMFSKHLQGDTIMYTNTDHFSVINYLQTTTDVGKTLGNASTYPAAQTDACAI